MIVFMFEPLLCVNVVGGCCHGFDVVVAVVVVVVCVDIVVDVVVEVVVDVVIFIIDACLRSSDFCHLVSFRHLLSRWLENSRVVFSTHVQHQLQKIQGNKIY